MNVRHRIMSRVFWCALLVVPVLPGPATAVSNELTRIVATRNTVAISLSARPEYYYLTMAQPPGVMIEFADTRYPGKQGIFSTTGKMITGLRAEQSSVSGSPTARVFIDLRSMVKYRVIETEEGLLVEFSNTKDAMQGADEVVIDIPSTRKAAPPKSASPERSPAPAVMPVVSLPPVQQAPAVSAPAAAPERKVQVPAPISGGVAVKPTPVVKTPPPAAEILPGVEADVELVRHIMLEDFDVEDSAVSVYFSSPVSWHTIPSRFPRGISVEFTNTEFSLRRRDVMVRNAMIRKVTALQFRTKPFFITRLTIEYSNPERVADVKVTRKDKTVRIELIPTDQPKGDGKR